MIKLIHGRGQLGTALGELLQEKENKFIDLDVIIYHTWNFLDKREEVQKKHYEDFKKFVDENPGKKIVFISTISQAENPYVFYKQLSEIYLLKNNENGFVIRLPNMIGKGICQRFRTENVDPFGEMELITIKEGARSVLNFIKTNISIRNFTVKGSPLSAALTKNLIVFGRDGKLLD